MSARPPLGERRARLIELAALQRATLTAQMQPLQSPLALVDRGLATVRYVRQHPQWLLGGVVVLVVAKPSLVRRWLLAGWTGWQTLQRLRLW